MTIDSRSEQGRAVRQLIPLATLPFSKFESLCKQLKIEEANDGDFLFRIGESSKDLFFLVDGSINLRIDGLEIETINAGTDSARFALAHQIPRKVNGVANGRIRFLRLNPDMMNSVEEAIKPESNNIMIDDELEDNDDWMTTLLKSPVFRMLPPANLQKVLISLQEISFNAGDVIIHQGDEGDYYYIIKKGLCTISRKPAANSKEIKLGQLSDLDTFGEDALISGQPRNVTITAFNNVSLLRLGKEQFLSLIKQPTLKYISYPETLELLSKGAELIDVREPDDFKKINLPKSINIPFFTLRMQMKNLNRQKPVIVVCWDGKTSETASFILVRHKFNALVLIGGINRINTSLQQERTSIEEVLVKTDGNNDVEECQETLTDNALSENDPDNLRRIIKELNNQCAILEAENKTLKQQNTELLLNLNELKTELNSREHK